MSGFFLTLASGILVTRHEKEKEKKIAREMRI